MNGCDGLTKQQQQQNTLTHICGGESRSLSPQSVISSTEMANFIMRIISSSLFDRN